VFQTKSEIGILLSLPTKRTKRKLKLISNLEDQQQKFMMDNWQASEKQRLFAYGTLRQDDLIKRLLGHRFQQLGRGLIDGRLFKVRDYPGIKLDSSPCYPIIGDILQLNEMSDWSVLDEYEGCAGHSPSPFEFTRRQHWITNPRGMKILAWVYSYQPSTDGLVEITSGDYLAYVEANNHNTSASPSTKR
jgi:gamma-glutamylcyclotransferase (GGCT)/AIG2-like uncharacterized protein YtfP